MSDRDHHGCDNTSTRDPASGWTLVRGNSEEESDSGSTSSSDFVHVDDPRTVSYHHKPRGGSVEDDNQRDSSVESDGIALLHDDELHADGVHGHVMTDRADLQAPEIIPAPESTQTTPSTPEILEASDPESLTLSDTEMLTDRELVNPSDPELVDPFDPDSVDPSEPELLNPSDPELVDSSDPELVDSSDPELVDPSDVDRPRCTPDLLDEQVVTALTQSGSLVTSGVGGVDDKVTVLMMADDADADEDDISGDDSVDYVHHHHQPSTTTDNKVVTMDTGSQSSSSIEELSMPEEGVIVDEHNNQVMEGVHYNSQHAEGAVGNSHKPRILRLPSIELLMKNNKSSDSDSDASDIVRIDHPLSMYEQPSTSHQSAYHRAVDLMQVSCSSTSSGNSTSRFHFVHRIPGHHRYVFPREDEEDLQSLPGDIDDRVESEISGVAFDDSDLDLSTISYNLDELELLQGDAIRTYKHRPNSSLNTFLTIVALLTLTTTIGVAIGHYLGSQREVSLRGLQGVRIKEIQDDYLSCLRNQDLLRAQISVTDQQKIAAVTAVWKQKYEELIIEKVELEYAMKQVEKQMDDGLIVAQNKLLAQRDEASLLLYHIDSLNLQNEEQLTDRSTGLAEREAVLGEKEAALVDKEATFGEKEAKFGEKETALGEKEAAFGEKEAALVDKEVVLSQKEAAVGEKEALVILKETVTDKKESNVVEKENQLVNTEHELTERFFQLATLETEIQERARELDLQEGTIGEKMKGLMSRQTSLEQREAGPVRAQTPDIAVDDISVDLDEDVLIEDEEPFDDVTPSRPLLRRQINVHDEDDKQVLSLMELRDLQRHVNELETENDDLRHQVALIRYSAYQHIQQPPSTTSEWKEQVNILANENTDLKSVVGRLRYGNQVTEEDEYTEWTLDPAQNESDPSQKDSAPDSTEDSDTHEEVLETAPDAPDNSVWYYMKMLLPEIELTQIQRLITGAITTEPLVSQVKFVQNMTSNVNISAIVREKWSKLQDLIGRDNIDTVHHKIKHTVEELTDLFTNEKAKFDKYVTSERVKEAKNSVDSVVQSIMNSTHVARYQEFVNKTKESVTDLSNKIKQTWHKVKNLTGDFLVKNKVHHLGDAVSKQIKKVSKTLEDGWKKVQKHLKKADLKEEKHKKKKNDEFQGPHMYKGEIPQQQHTPYNIYDREEDLPQDHDQLKHDHRNKESSNADYIKYEEYWRQANFEPDDFLQEGFFEGNNRQWHKHQKRACKLAGRMQKLNDEMFLSMDEDDVEDMYEDFEDFQEDTDVREQPELMTWLTCQLRWWKSRLYRKHSNEDIVKGCGRQLMRWQLRALCRPCALCMPSGPLCQYFVSVIQPHIKSHRNVITVSLDGNHGDSTHKHGEVRNQYGRLRYSLSLDDIEHDPEFVENNATQVEEEEISGMWQFERAEIRESYHHDGSWMFKRRANRDFERNKPWYYQRADKRADKRLP